MGPLQKEEGLAQILGSNLVPWVGFEGVSPLIWFGPSTYLCKRTSDLTGLLLWILVEGKPLPLQGLLNRNLGGLTGTGFVFEYLSQLKEWVFNCKTLSDVT